MITMDGLPDLGIMHIPVYLLRDSGSVSIALDSNVLLMGGATKGSKLFVQGCAGKRTLLLHSMMLLLHMHMLLRFVMLMVVLMDKLLIRMML